MNFFSEINRRKFIYRLKIILLLMTWSGVFTYIVWDYYSLDKKYKGLITQLDSQEANLDKIYIQFNDEDIEKENLLIEDYEKYINSINRQLDIINRHFLNSENLTAIKQCFPQEARLRLISIEEYGLTLEGYVTSMEIVAVILQNLENTGLFTDKVETLTQNLNEIPETENSQTEGIYFKINCDFIGG